MLSRPVKANPEAQWERSKYRDNPEPQSYAAKLSRNLNLTTNDYERGSQSDWPAQRLSRL
jgi:hypothetical protein